MSETLQIMVDDTDPAIKYSGNWVADKGSLDNLGNFGAPYMSTSHYIKGTGSFSFTFSGTYVGVFGSSVDGNNPSRVCTVDGATVPNNEITSVVNNIMQCQVDGLADGQHTLVVTVPTANPNGYWVDMLLYIPSVSVSRANAALEIEWDDPSMLYGTGWTQSAPGMIATTNGASMTVTFTGRVLTWTGYYFSQLPTAPTTATYTIDGGSPFSFDLNGIAAQSTGAELNQRFFTTGILPSGQHILKVTYNGNSGATPLSVYSIIVQNGASADSSIGGAIGASSPVSAPATGGSGGGGSGSGGSGSGGSSSGTTAAAASIPPLPSTSVMVIGSGASAVTVTVSNTNSTATILPSPIGSGSGSSTLTGSAAISSDKSSSGDGTPADANSGNGSGAASGAATSSHSHLGAILGAVIGVLAFIILLLLLVFFLRRRHRKRRQRATSVNASRADLIAQPFTDPPTSVSPPPMSEYPPSSEYSSSSSGGAPVPNSQFYSDVKRPVPVDGNEATAGPSAALWRLQTGGFHHASQPSQSLSTFSSPATATTDGTEAEVIMRHEDSGVRIPMQPRPGVTVVEMPPLYSAA